AWTMLQGIAAGNVPTPLAADEATGIIIGEAFAAETVNTDMAKQLLSSAVANLPEDPQQYATSMRLLTALAQEPTLYFLHLSKPAAPAAAAGQPQPGQPGQPGSYSGAGMSSPGYDPTAAGVNEEAMTSTGEDLAAAYSGGQPGAAAAAAPTMGNMSLPTVRLPQAAMLPVAGVLWSSETAGMLTERLKAAKTLEETTESLALAANTPTQPSRKAIQELFSRLFDKGANGLVSSGVLSAAGDPGMLPILKSLPRRRPAKAPAGGGPPEMTPADTWAMATGEYVLALRDRLRKLAEDTSIPNEPEHRLRLHPDAPQPERSIALIGPDDAARELGEATPVATSVYYTRLVVAPEREIQMKDIVDYYEKRTKGFRREDRARGILWYDGVKKNSDGTLETMDVVIQQAGAAGAAGFAGGGESGGGGQPGAFRFQIEILVVVTKDPAGESETAAVERSRN
ncbi:MAG: hypothetical protein KDA89_21090, partial [Planctomycetaceae bacterium]|nr:hypothetical protein [Planctomycetaceae bacterium]